MYVGHKIVDLIADDSVHKLCDPLCLGGFVVNAFLDLKFSIVNFRLRGGSGTF